jgi:hypothetical protein
VARNRVEGLSSQSKIRCRNFRLDATFVYPPLRANFGGLIATLSIIDRGDTNSAREREGTAQMGRSKRDDDAMNNVCVVMR